MLRMVEMVTAEAPQDLNLAFSNTMSASITVKVDDSKTDENFKSSVGPDHDKSADDDGANLMYF